MRQGIPPTPENFRLTQERVNYFERAQFGLQESDWHKLWWGIFALTALFLYMTESGLGLWDGLIVVLLFAGLAFVLLGSILLTIGEVHKQLHKFSSGRQRDYPAYLQYSRSRAAFEAHHRELLREQYLRQEDERRRLAAERRRLLEERRKQDKWWKSLDGHRFETELAKLFEKRGYGVQLTSASGDQGVDMFLDINGKKVVVQCKAHKNKVGPGVVRDLFGTMMHFGANEAWLVATAGFHSGAKSFAKGKPIKLLTIADILKMAT